MAGGKRMRGERIRRALRVLAGRETGPAPPDAVPPEIASIAGHSMASPRLLRKLRALASDAVARGVPGDFVECGVWNGGSAAAVAGALVEGGRRVWLYDSFAGLPAPTERDGALAADFAGKGVGSVDKVREAFAAAGFPWERAVVRAGWFEETFRQQPAPGPIAMLHVDCDWHESVLLTLETFYDRVSEGGIVVLDDFGHWEGAREAFYDFVSRRGIRPLLERYGHTQAYWVKGRAHNRDFSGRFEYP